MALVNPQQPVMLNTQGTANPADANNDATLIATPVNSDTTLKKGVAPGPEDPITRQRRLLQAATVAAASGQGSILDNFQQFQDNGVPGDIALRQQSDKWNQDVKNSMNDMIQGTFSNIPNPVAYVQAAKQVQDTNDLLHARESGGIRTFVDANTNNISPDVQEVVRSRLQMIDMAEEIIKNTSVLDRIGDFATSLIPGKVTIDNWQAMGFTINPFKSAEDYRKLALKVQSLPPDEALAQFKLLKEDWLDKLPPDKAATLLLGLVDPSQTEDAANELGIYGAINNVADMAVFYGAIARLRKLYTPIASAAVLGNKTGAADINISVMQGNQDISKAASTNLLTANVNASPFKAAEVMPGVVEDISPALHERLFEYRDLINKVMGNLSEGNGFVREGFLDEGDKAKALRRIDDEWKQWTEQMLRGENKIIRLTSKEETNRGVNFEFEVTDPYGNISLGKTEMPFKQEDITFWSNIPDNPLGTYFGSQTWQARASDYLDSVKTAIRLDTTSASIATQLRSVIKAATQSIRDTRSPWGLSRKQRLDKVDAILLLGDRQKKVFSAKELAMGVNGIQLDNAEIEAYWKLRSAFDSLGVLRNQEEWASMAADGYKQVNFGHDLFRFGKVLNTPEEARAALSSDNSIVSIWRHDGRDAGQAVRVRDLELEKQYAEGWRVVKLRDDVQRKAGIFKHVMVYGDGMTDGMKTLDELPPLVMDLKPGYVPRLNKNSTWFVQAIRDGYVDGTLKPGSRRKAVRSFDNEADAHAWAKSLYEHATDAGFDTNTRFIVVKDGELEAFKAGDSQLGATNGLITGPRAKEPIPHGLPGQYDIDEMRVGAFEALELYLENTNSFMTRNQFRMGMRKKWENSVKQELGLKVSFDEPGAVLSNDKYRHLYDKIQEWSGFRDKSEQAFSETVRKVYEWAIPKIGRNPLTQFILDRRHGDPLGYIRSGAFHALLGTYNPAQLYVQANGAAVALSVHLSKVTNAALRLSPGGVAGAIGGMLSAFSRQGALALIDNLPKGAAIPEKVMKFIGKTNGFKSVQELESLKRIWDKSGYFDSVLTSADVEAAARGYAVTSNAFKKFFDSGLMFYRGGELFNRRFSFITAVDELGGAMKVEQNPDLLKQAITRANDMMLNLGHANKAWWQKGITSIPTQFLQIQAKTLETIYGALFSKGNTTLTPSEGIHLLLSQAMLYGPAGIFGGRYISKYVADALGKDQIDINNLPPEQVAFANGGVTDYMLAVLGIDGSISDRAALVNGLDQSITSLWTKDNTLAEWLLGPGGVPLKRVWQAWALAAPVGWAAKPVDGAVDATPQDITDTLQFMLTNTSEMAIAPFSTASQISRFLLMKDLGVLKDTQGNTISAPLGGYNPQTEWAALIGIKPNDLQRKFDIADMNKAYEDAVDLRVNMLMHLFDDYMLQVDRHVSGYTPMEVEAQRQFRKRWHVTIDSIQDEGLREKVRQRWGDALERRLTGDSQLDRQVQTYYRNMVTELVGAHTSTGTRFVQTKENDENGVQ